MTNKEISKRLNELEQQLANIGAGNEQQRIIIKMVEPNKHIFGWVFDGEVIFLQPGETDKEFCTRLLKLIPENDTRKMIYLKSFSFDDNKSISTYSPLH